MLRFLVFIVPVLSQDILGVNYSFEMDFYRTFNYKSCTDRLPWHITEYESISVPKPNEKSYAAIVASKNSCVSSFPIILLPESNLEFVVYMQTASNCSGLVISVINEENNSVVINSYYNKTTDGFVAGWSVLKLEVKEDGVFYINLRGHSRKGEIVLIDSFQFIPSNTKIEKDVDQNKLDEILKVPNTLILSNEFENYDEILEEDEEGSGDYEELIIEPEPESSIGVLTIILISVGGIIVLSVVGVGAYILGKARGLAAASGFDFNIEPPRVYNIPRVRGVANNLYDEL